MKHLSYLFYLLLLLSCKPSTPPPTVLTVASGRVERLENFSSKFVTPRNIDIWLPENYNSEASYSVLYMQDGQMLYDSTTTWNKQEWKVDETVSKLINESIIKPVIVVGIWNAGENRRSEYFPQRVFESLPDTFQERLYQNKDKNQPPLFASKVYSDSYLKFLVTELKPYIDQHYSTKTDKENTIIMGSSMGGLISCYAVCEYPEIFGGAGCISTHWIGIYDAENNPIPDAFLDYLYEYFPEPGGHKFYFDYGTRTLDSLYEPHQMRVDSLISTKGYDSDNWKTSKYPDADHSEKSWQRRLHIPLRFLLEEL